ncbi:hypothetical protein [Methylobacterium soli]|uniref:Uncharacterized protein n=1 Tax=Methylobacterium soli TaxID=553447 RepID=A0A6L3SRK6_9HYPH|nr:hypothetical protein [Methylobacterium soli]KAB1071696.1 hypothetical protein F6X53_28875 [Methylobacterium soli]GJE45749.1 hypothetical protein AEGHOMDF_4949 [Methylobacterium soli]
MTVRAASLFAALGLGAFASTVFAGESRTFTAWGHEFETPGGAATIVARSTPSSYTVLPPAPATASRTLPVARQEIEPKPATPAPTINAWGARFSTSGR